VLLLRFFEAGGPGAAARSPAIKKRAGPHEDAIREFRDARRPAARRAAGFQGVLRGVPTYVGQSGAARRAASEP
jgi:circadian clock protein KaiC